MNTTTQIKLQVPMSRAMRDGLERYAKNMGFDSSQAYIRFIAKAAADGRKIRLSEDDWGEPSPAATKRLNRAAEEAKRGLNASKPFSTVDEALAHLNSLQ